jgi:hypothetical protein
VVVLPFRHAELPEAAFLDGAPTSIPEVQLCSPSGWDLRCCKHFCTTKTVWCLL